MEALIPIPNPVFYICFSSTYLNFDNRSRHSPVPLYALGRFIHVRIRLIRLFRCAEREDTRSMQKVYVDYLAHFDFPHGERLTRQP